MWEKTVGAPFLMLGGHDEKAKKNPASIHGEKICGPRLKVLVNLGNIFFNIYLGGTYLKASTPIFRHTHIDGWHRIWGRFSNGNGT